MKSLGFTQSGGTIIELSVAEAAVLGDALRALDGKTSFSMTRSFLPEERDLSPLFRMLLEWTAVRLSINHVRSLLDDLQETIEGRFDMEETS